MTVGPVASANQSILNTLAMIRFLFQFTLAFVLSITAFAADAVFSRDGDSVIFLPRTEESIDHLCRVDLKTNAVEKIPLTLPKGESIRSLACGAEGETFLLTSEAVYIFDKKGTRRLCEVGDVKEVNDLATVPPREDLDMADWLIVTGSDRNIPSDGRSFYARKPGTKSFVSVFSRRILKVGAGAFSPEGRYFFQADNALWEGHFGWGADEGDPSLTAVIVAPLAYCDSSISNTGAFTVGDSVAVAGNGVFVVLSGRHGDDRLLRVTMPSEPPAANGTDSGATLAEYYSMQAKTLSSVKVLEENVDIESLAATVVKGEERVFYIVNATRNMQLMLWSSRSGKSRAIGEPLHE